MNILLNGEHYDIENNNTVSMLFAKLGLSSDKVMACAINGNIVKKDDWDTREIEEGDHLELLNFVGGG